MSVFFSTETPTDDPQLADLWDLLENEEFEAAMDLAEPVCEDPDAPIEFFCGLSLAYGESGYYEDAERTARTAISFGESNWHARHALAVALMHQGRFLGALDTLGFYRTPLEVYVVRAQIETMGMFYDSLQQTLQDALDKDAPPAIQLYLAYLYTDLTRQVRGWGDTGAGVDVMLQLGDHIAVWDRDLARHATTPYAEVLQHHISGIDQILSGG
ncbi:MAG: hypothetical protein GYB65_06410 [Chloroflexi bacterium]|nr:hypothetical protein [Chloroflexota bacterium]